jgi:hypothetical protein
MLDPSNVRVSDFPSLVSISSDNYSDSEASQFSGNIDSLLSLDLTAFTIFHTKILTEATPKEPVPEVTMESYKATIEMQNEKIEKQEAQIEFLITTIQQLNASMNNKFDRMLHLITYKPTEETQPEVETIASNHSDSSDNPVTTSKPKSFSQTMKKQKTTPVIGGTDNNQDLSSTSLDTVLQQYQTFPTTLLALNTVPNLIPSSTIQNLLLQSQSFSADTQVLQYDSINDLPSPSLNKIQSFSLYSEYVSLKRSDR